MAEDGYAPESECGRGRPPPVGGFRPDPPVSFRGGSGGRGSAPSGASDPAIAYCIVSDVWGMGIDGAPGGVGNEGTGKAGALFGGLLEVYEGPSTCIACGSA